VLCVVNGQVYYELKNIGISTPNLDLWISINSLYQNMMGYKKKILFFKIFKY
jgi:hypothetical protein